MGPGSSAASSSSSTIAVVKLHFNGESGVPPRQRPSAGIGESRLSQYENAWNKNRGLGGYRRSSSGLSFSDERGSVQPSHHPSPTMKSALVLKRRQDEQRNTPGKEK